MNLHLSHSNEHGLLSRLARVFSRQIARWDTDLDGTRVMSRHHMGSWEMIASARARCALGGGHGRVESSGRCA